MNNFNFGSTNWPGLAKLIEECGEVIQVAGKIMATNGEVAHWDGTDLRDRLQEEIGDLVAAIGFVGEYNDLDLDTVEKRIDKKAELFEKWHKEHLDGASS
jgi:NTP pyrophosphatase (non-canonical NTP hydrolase)